MKTWMIVFVIGIVTAVLGCATKEVQDGAITVSPEQIFGGLKLSHGRCPVSTARSREGLPVRRTPR